ncbi:MAG TPA: hypothetical protein VKV04_18885 [Verrucomicrobiae bacterium]|nr:hypothetical protein [Verrucomicrobiae bacterium]
MSDLKNLNGSSVENGFNSPPGLYSFFTQSEAPADPDQVIGALARGVAHDFNNVLTAVICRLEHALKDNNLSAETREDLLQALACARRGVDLNKKWPVSNPSICPPQQHSAKSLKNEIGYPHH